MSGFLASMHGAAVTRKTKSQTVAATSSAHSECVDLSEACKEMMHVRQTAAELGHKENTPTDLHCDGSAAAAMTKNPGFTQRSKSMRPSHHNVRDCQHSKMTCIKKINGKENPADTLTKPPSKASTQRHNQHFFDVKCDNDVDNVNMLLYVHHYDDANNDADSDNEHASDNSERTGEERPLHPIPPCSPPTHESAASVSTTRYIASSILQNVSHAVRSITPFFQTRRNTPITHERPSNTFTERPLQRRRITPPTTADAKEHEILDDDSSNTQQHDNETRDATQPDPVVQAASPLTGMSADTMPHYDANLPNDE